MAKEREGSNRNGFWGRERGFQLRGADTVGRECHKDIVTAPRSPLCGARTTLTMRAFVIYDPTERGGLCIYGPTFPGHFAGLD